MSLLAEWLQEHQIAITEMVRQECQQQETLFNQASQFTEAFIRAADGQIEILHAVLKQWVKPGESQLSLLLNMQHKITQHIRKTSSPEKALDLLDAIHSQFAGMTLYLAQQEADNLQKEVEIAKSEAQRLDRHKSDFISVAAHELKTPLTLIEGYTNMLQSDFKEPEQPRVVMMLNGIAGGTRRLREIIDDLIDVAVIDMKLMSLHLQPVWIRRLLNLVVTEMGKIAAERKIKILFQPETLPDASTYGDPERLYQVFEKLLENAVKYTPDGGEIKVFGQLLEDKVEVVIQDNGIGLDAKDLQLIFEKFFSLGQVSLHSSSKSHFKGGGPGLGLTIAKGIVEAHGGTLRAESDGYDEQRLYGSRFYVTLPMRNSPAVDKLIELMEGHTHPALLYPLDK